MPPHPARPFRGFTLIELSIVLVIVGLVVGGIMARQEMVKQAQIRKLGTELSSIDQAVDAFQIKYDCLPGDCANASQYFSATNGDGNHRIGGFVYTPYTEVWQFWSQLATAGLVSGSYSGSGAGRAAVIGTNVMASSAYPSVGFTVVNGGGYADTVNDWQPNVTSYETKNMVFFGKNTGFETYGPFLTGTDAYALDIKFDDGAPGRGRIMHEHPVYYTGCTTTTNPATATYDFTQNLPYCIMRFYTLF